MIGKSLDYIHTNGVGSLTSKRIHRISCDLLISVAAEKSRLAPPSQELFQKSTIEKYIYYTMVVTVFLLFCTVLSFTWGPKCILCVSIVIYQEFCEILWHVFVLVLLYLVSCIFSTVSSLSMSNSLSLTYSFSVLPFFQSQLVSNCYAQYFLNLTEREWGGGQLIFTKKTQHTIERRR